MAPIKKIKTYGRSNRSLVNNSVDAEKLIFRKNKPKARRKRRLLIKELPSRAIGETLLGQDSFHVSTEDTFDKLMNGNNSTPIRVKPQISLVDAENISKSIKTVNKFYSPIMSRRKNKIASVVEVSSSIMISNKNQSQPQNNSSQSVKSVNDLFSPIVTRSRRKPDSITSSAENISKKNGSDSIIPRFKEPTVDRIDCSLEVEKVRKPAPNSLSYIIIPEIKHAEMSIHATLPDNSCRTNIDASFEPIFTKTFREKQLIHSSTPLAPMKSKKIINYTISPIKNVSTLENSGLATSKLIVPIKPCDFLKSPRRSNVANPKSTLSTSSRIVNHFDVTNSDVKLTNKSESQTESQKFQKSIGSKNFSLIKNLSLPQERRVITTRDSFITLRRRKVLKNSHSRTSKNRNKSASKTHKSVLGAEATDAVHKSSSVEDLSVFVEPKSKLSGTTHNLKDFELFETENKDLLKWKDFTVTDSSVKFVNKRRRRLTDSFLSSSKKHKVNDSVPNDRKSVRRLSLQQSSLCRDVLIKDIVVLLPQMKISRSSSLDTSLSDLSKISSSDGNPQTLTNCSSTELDTSSSGSYVISDDDFFRLKNPEFKNLAINVTRLVFDQQPSNLEMRETNNSIESLRNESASLFDSCDQSNRNNDLSRILDNIETKNCSLVNQREILNLIKRSIGSNIPNKSSMTEKNEIAVRENDLNSENRVSNCNKNNDNIERQEIDSEDIFRNITKRSRSTKRSEISDKCVHSISDSVDENQVEKELIVNVTKSPWRRKNRQSALENISDGTVIDLTDSFDKSKKSTLESNDAEIQQFPTHHMSDIIESSVLECSQVDTDGFKIPVVNNPKKWRSKALVLKAGKLWRRSLSVYKRSSVMLTAVNENACNLANGNFCACPRCNIARQSMRLSDRRFSIKIVPAKTLVDSQREISILENYAHNTSYVSDRILEDNLENDLRSLSLSKKKLSIVQNSAPITARELVLKRCGQEEPLPFEECYPKSVLQNCQKIGEGVYGEVFLFRNPNGGTSVMKIIPIEGDLIVNGERQKKFEEILSEITIALELSNLRNNKQNKTSGFSEVQKVCCVQGRYPEKLVDLWDLYDETRGSENDSPEVFGEDQLYIVLQLANGGSDLEAYIFNNALQAYTMFQQVACALAVAEEELQFEHRDLHWGNILLSAADKNSKVTFRLDGKNYDIKTRGVEVSIIDFTLSRIECDGVVIFNDLGLDPELFTAEGDYQFEVYKLMQNKNGNNWQRFEPYTNVLWLHYTLDKAIAALRYKNTKTKVHKEYLCKLRQLKDVILDYNSVKEFVSENF